MIKQHYQNLPVSPETHRRIRGLAVAQGVTITSLTERLLRLGMVAPDLAEALLDFMDADEYDRGTDSVLNVTQAALDAYRAALDGKETP